MEHRHLRSASTVAVLVAVVLGLAGCGSGGGGAGAVASTTAPRSSSTSPSTVPGRVPDGTGKVDDGKAPDMHDLRGVRYCEVLLLRHHDDQGFRADVWNSMGMSDCPPDQWAALDAARIAKERGALAAVLNGPRYWTLDSIDTKLRAGAEETTFGRIGMFKAATVGLGEDPKQTPYTERKVARDTVFGFRAGREVYELVAPDGSRYVMQARSQIVDPTLEESDLPALGDRLELPAGWRYQVRTLARPIELHGDPDGTATVVQDELQNTYQRLDQG